MCHLGLLLVFVFGLSLTDGSPSGSKSVREWDKTLEISNKIMANYATMPDVELFRDLAWIKKTINGEVTRKIPPRYFDGRSDAMVNVLALARLTELNVEKCTEPNLDTYEGQLQRASYVDLFPLLKEKFNSENMLKLINFYYQSQLMICGNALEPQFERRALEYVRDRSDSDQIIAYWQSISKSFPQDVQFSQLNKSQKMVAIARFIAPRLNAKSIEKALVNYDFQFEVMESAVLRNCRIFLIEPFGTMMRTCDAIGRHQIAHLSERYELLMRAYDVCAETRNLHKMELRTILDRLLKPYPNETSATTRLEVGQASALPRPIPDYQLISQQQQQQPIQPQGQVPIIGSRTSAFRRVQPILHSGQIQQPNKDQAEPKDQ